MTSPTTNSAGELKPTAWIKWLKGADCKPDGRCYDITFSDPNDDSYEPLYARTASPGCVSREAVLAALRAEFSAPIYQSRLPRVADAIIASLPVAGSEDIVQTRPHNESSGHALGAESKSGETLTEVAAWALCAHAGGAGRGKCDLRFCNCGAEGKAVLEAVLPLITVQKREPGEVHPILGQMDEMHDIGFKNGWSSAAESAQEDLKTVRGILEVLRNNVLADVSARGHVRYQANNALDALDRAEKIFAAAQPSDALSADFVGSLSTSCLNKNSSEPRS